MGVFDRFRRKRPITEDERRAFLMKNGRITEGLILDSEELGDDEVVFYIYTLNGVDFESSERLTRERRRDPLKYAPGQKVSVRFDPKNQGNSILE
jgi:hypothetical protein